MAFQIFKYTCGGTALAAFETNYILVSGRHWRHLSSYTDSNGGTALAEYEINTHLVVGQCWRHLTLTLYPLRRDGVGGI